MLSHGDNDAFQVTVAAAHFAEENKPNNTNMLAAQRPTGMKVVDNNFVPVKPSSHTHCPCSQVP